MNMEVSVSPHQQQSENDLAHNLPGFRFHPTEEELLGFYLKKMVQGKLSSHIKIIRVLDLYRYDPWDLPGLAGLGGREWFFFVPRDRKVSRPNRLTVSGYWKASGSDKQILDAQAKCIGFKRTLVFYTGRSPCGRKTDWIMNEYRMPGLQELLKKNDVVLCRVYRKAVSLKSIELRAMAEMGKQSGLEGCLEEKRVASELDYTKIEAQNCPKDGNLTNDCPINHTSPSTKSPKCEDRVEHGVVSTPLSTNFCDDIEGKTPIELESFMEHELGIKEANTERNSMEEYNPLWSPTRTPATWCHSLSFSDSQHPQEVMGWMNCT